MGGISVNKMFLAKLIGLIALIIAIDALAYHNSQFDVRYSALLFFSIPFYIFSLGVFAKQKALQVIGVISFIGYLFWLTQFVTTRNESLAALGLLALWVFIVSGLASLYIGTFLIFTILRILDKRKKGD
jgi:hypothetical protein